MKHVIQLLLILLPLSVCYAEFDVPHVAVFGIAEKKVVPDELHWNLSVKTLGGTVVEVSDNHTTDVSSVLNYLRESGLSEEDIRTSRMQLNENMVYRNNSRLREGYFAYTGIRFKTTDFSGYLEHWKQLVTFNNLTINSVAFALSNRIAVQNETRIVAVKKAKEKAMSLAGALGAEVLEPLLLEEMGSSSGAPRNMALSMETARAKDSGGSISPGQETVRAVVKVLFRISGR